MYKSKMRVKECQQLAQKEKYLDSSSSRLVIDMRIAGEMKALLGRDTQMSIVIRLR